jgi:hypothetical protein
MNAHTSQVSVNPARVERRIARLQRGLRRAEDISEWNRLQAELQHLTTQHLRLVDVH